MGKTNINDLLNQVKLNNHTSPIQKVISVKKANKDEIQFSFYIEKELFKKIKYKALENDVSIKSIINDAIKYHIEKGK